MFLPAPIIIGALYMFYIFKLVSFFLGHLIKKSKKKKCVIKTYLYAGMESSSDAWFIEQIGTGTILTEYSFLVGKWDRGAING